MIAAMMQGSYYAANSDFRGVCNSSEYWRTFASVGGRKRNMINQLSELLIRWSQVRIPHGLPVSKEGLPQGSPLFFV